MDLKPIPAFYCCYLLRSTIRHSALYVGSTPNPVRRLAQHNGLSKGGAVRTSRDTLQPWEMVCIVSGFPSKIAALQFEWAWQNTHLTRHISAEERITVRHTNVRTSPRSGRTRRRPVKPRVSITDKLSNLHLLLRGDAFARLPLEVRFFSEDIYQVWLRWAERVQGNIRDGIRILLDMKRDEVPAPADDPCAPPPSSQPRRPKKADTIGKGGVEGIDVSYNPIKAHVEKSMELLADHKDVSCAVCHAYVQKLERNMAVTCPHDGCNAISHLTCLSKHFLAGEDENVLIPTEGTCPSCQSEVRWIEVVQELSLRSRGGTELTKLMKKPREKKLKEVKGAKKLVAAMDVDDDEGDDDEAVHEEDGLDEDQDDEETGKNAGLISDTPDDDWLYREPDDDEDVMSVMSTVSDTSMDLPDSKRNGLTRSGVAQPTDRIVVVIEDSETEDMEILG